MTDFNSNISLILPIKRETKEISGKLFNFQLICKTVKRQLKIHSTTTNNNHCCDYYYCYFYYCYCCYLCDQYCLVMYSILRKSCFIFKKTTVGRRAKCCRTTPPAGNIGEMKYEHALKIYFRNIKCTFLYIKVAECLFSFLLTQTTMQSFTCRCKFKDPVKPVLVNTELKALIPMFSPPMS